MSDGFLLACGSCTLAIDLWTAAHADAFFLTHMHADHYKGLSNGWCQGTIYCSEITGALLQRKWPSLVPKLIPVDESVCLRLDQTEQVMVTAIDANHCPVSKLSCSTLAWASSTLFQLTVCSVLSREL